MINPGATAAILLAAGSSRRFAGDKLAAPIGEETVLGLSARALAASGCALRVAVVRGASNPHASILKSLGFEIVINEKANEGLSRSLRAGVEWAERQSARGVLVALADMPFITAEHYRRLFEKADATSDCTSYTICDERRSPPAIFGAEWFNRLRDLCGDAGARTLLATISENVAVNAPADMLTDIDTPDDLHPWVTGLGGKA